MSDPLSTSWPTPAAFDALCCLCAHLTMAVDQAAQGIDNAEARKAAEEQALQLVKMKVASQKRSQALEDALAPFLTTGQEGE